MNPKTSLLNWLPALLLVALSGCSTTKLTDSWQAPGFQRKSMDKVLVVAMTANPTNRILFEEGFRKALQDKGIQATASHTAIGDAMPNRETVTAYVQKHGIDFVGRQHRRQRQIPPGNALGQADEIGADCFYASSRKLGRGRLLEGELRSRAARSAAP